MDLIVIIVGLGMLFGGLRVRDTGADIPLMVGGGCVALFGVAWFIAGRFSNLW